MGMGTEYCLSESLPYPRNLCLFISIRYSSKHLKAGQHSWLLESHDVNAFDTRLLRFQLTDSCAKQEKGNDMKLPVSPSRPPFRLLFVYLRYLQFPTALWSKLSCYKPIYVETWPKDLEVGLSSQIVVLRITV
jgi:hypothetical protein